MESVKKLFQVFLFSFKTIIKEKPENVTWSEWYILKNTGFIIDWEYFPPIWYIALREGLRLWWKRYAAN